MHDAIVSFITFLNGSEAETMDLLRDIIFLFQDLPGSS